MTNIDLTPRETSWFRWLPGLALLQGYKPSWLPRDLIAGLVLTTMLAPVGVAYAVASGVGPIYGLYATVACLLAYAVFGPSRILVLGPDSSLATVIFGVIAPLSAGDPGRAVALASMMALVSGAILVVAGIARLGFCDGPALKAHTLRVHEWHRADRVDQPTAETPWLQD